MELIAQELSFADITLTPMTEKDREALRGPADHFEIWKLMSLRGDGKYFDRWFSYLLDDQAKGNSISHVIRKNGQVVGHSAYLVINPVFDRVEIGWTWYVKAERGTKLNPTCKYLLLGRAFACGAERVELKTHHKNLHSQNAMLKMGAKKEGVLRHHAKNWDGSFRNSVYFSVLREEWPQVEAGLLARIS